MKKLLIVKLILNKLFKTRFVVIRRNNMFKAIQNGNIEKVEELCKNNPELVNESITEKEFNELFFGGAIFNSDRSKQITPCDFAFYFFHLRKINIEIFQLLVNSGGKFNNDILNRAIDRYDGGNCEWLNVLLSIDGIFDEICDYYNAIKYSMSTRRDGQVKNSAFMKLLQNFDFPKNIIFKDDAHMFFNSKIKYPYSLPGYASNVKQVEMLSKNGVTEILSGDIVVIIGRAMFLIAFDSNDKGLIDVFKYILGKFVESESHTSKMLDIYDVQGGKFAMNMLVKEMFLEHYGHFFDGITIIEEILLDRASHLIPTLTQLAFASVKKQKQLGRLDEKSSEQYNLFVERWF